MAWVKGNVMVFLEGVGLPQDQVESIAVGQDAAIPANGVQEEGGSRTVLIMCLVIAVVAAGVPLFVIARRRTRRSAPVGPWPADSFQHSQYASPPYPVPVDAATPYASTPYASTPHASTGPVAVPPGWRPDPTGRYEQRYWSGAAWTEHVYSQGRSGYDLLTTPTSTALAAAPAAIPPLVWRDPNHVRDAGSPSSGENQDHPR
jgi:hypothetical protein